MHVYKFCEVYGICEVSFESIQIILCEVLKLLGVDNVKFVCMYVYSATKSCEV